MLLDDLSRDERKIVAALQQPPCAPAQAACPRIGEILLAAGEISKTQLELALERKTWTGRRIGEELIATGALPADRVSRALRLQRRLIMTALFTALAGQAQAAEVRASMSVTANVVDTVSIGSSYQAQNLVVTARDVERGYVEVPAASRFEIKSKGPSLLEFRGVSDVFHSVRVTGVIGTAEFGSGGGTLLQKPFRDGAGSVALNYRFELSPGVSPGPHKWPLSLTVFPM